MELGEKLRLSRLEAGLTQRQLCGDTITRNMLSQIESGKAHPSMATLQYLAARLSKSVSFFLEEDALSSPNAAVMAKARLAYGAKNTAEVLHLLRSYQSPDPLFEEEYGYLQAICSLEQGKLLLERGESIAAVALLEQLCRHSIYYREDMERQRRQLLSRGYEALEQHYKALQDYQQAYLYACKARALPR